MVLQGETVFDQGKIQSEPSPSDTALGLNQEEANGNASCKGMNKLMCLNQNLLIAILTITTKTNPA
jgi:hypothetical protein